MRRFKSSDVLEKTGSDSPPPTSTSGSPTNKLKIRRQNQISRSSRAIISRGTGYQDLDSEKSGRSTPFAEGYGLWSSSAGEPFQPKRKFSRFLDELNPFNDTKSLHLVIGLTIGLTYYLTVSSHFHSFTNLMSLTNLERQLSLPLETAFRFSYFKRIVDDKESFLDCVLYDNRTNYPSVTNSYHKYALLPEVVLGVGFRLARLFLGKDLKCYSYTYSHLSATWEDLKCHGTAEPLLFYLNANWAMDGTFVAFIYFTGYIIGKSQLSGFMAVLAFILNHPQLTDLEYMFPKADKLGVYASSAFLVLLPRLLLRKSHVPWTQCPKLSAFVAVIILIWPQESQWVLFVQLLTASLLYAWGLVSKYVFSVLLGSHLVGWQYASLSRLDLSFVAWSFYIYLFLSASCTVFLIMPLCDKYLGKRLIKWKSIRSAVLILTLYISFCEVRRNFHTLLPLQEDTRLSINFRGEFPIVNFLSRPAFSVGVDAKLLSPAQLKNQVDSMKFEKFPWMNKRKEKGAKKKSYTFTKVEIQQVDENEISEEDEDEESLSDGVSGDEEEFENEDTEDLSDMTQNGQDDEANDDEDETEINSHLKSKNEEIFKSVLKFCLTRSVSQPLLELIGNHWILVFLSVLSFAGVFLPYIETLQWKFKHSYSSHRMRKFVYHFLITFMSYFLAVFIHKKYTILFIANISLLAAYLPSFKDAKLHYLPESLRKRELLISIIAVAYAGMIAFAKGRLDEMYTSPVSELHSNSKSDLEALPELSELAKWAQNHRGGFIGPPNLMAYLYLSSGVGVTNHFFDTVPMDLKFLPFLYKLRDQNMTLEEFHRIFRKTDFKYLVVSKRFCSSSEISLHYVPTFAGSSPYASSAAPNEEETENVLGIRTAPKRKDLRRKAPSADHPKLSNLHETPNENLDNTDQDSTLEDCTIDKYFQGGSSNKMTVCNRLLYGEFDEILPFRSVFSNKYFSVVTYTTW